MFGVELPTPPDWVVWLFGPLLLLAALWWGIRERSVEGAARRGQRNVGRTLAGFGVVGAGVVGAFLGALDGLESVAWAFGDVLAAHLPTLAKAAGVIGGYGLLNRMYDLSTLEFVALAVVAFVALAALRGD